MGAMTATRRHPRAATLVRLVLAIVLAGAALLAAGPAHAQAGNVVMVTEVRGVITPVVADHLVDTLEDAGLRNAMAVVIEMDTPGGLVASTRVIVQALLNAPVPVIVHVTPRGADAGSAGTFITLAAHIAAMSPATTIGAATPVGPEGDEAGEKILNNAAAWAEAIAEERGRDVQFAVDSVRDGRSITATEALDIGAIDVIADTRADLLTAIDGAEVEVRGEAVTLATATASVEEVQWSWTRSILQQLANPNVAFLLLSLATLAILYEIANPGMGAGGIVGVLAFVLGLYGVAVLDVAFAGVALLVVAAVLFVIELFVPGIGVAAAGGTIALLLGGLFLFPRATGVSVGLGVLVPTVVAVGGLAVLIAVAAARTRTVRKRGVADDLVGRSAKLRATSTGEWRVSLDGTSWRVRPAEGVDPTVLDEGLQVTVQSADNLDLFVAPASDTETHPTSTT
jgi:membrane-bound serine protease (ClpP class)